MMKTLRYFWYGIRFVARRHILRQKIPFIAGLVVGESCNLDCKHCAVSRREGPHDLSIEEIRNGLQTLYNKGIRLLAITGGEPFIWKDKNHNLETIIQLSREMGFLIVSVYTNGTLPLHTSADVVFVSIDGLKETSKKLRGNVYDLVIQNIKESKHPNIIVNCTINNHNKDEIESLCEFVAGIENIQGIFFYFHTPYYGKDELFIPFEERKKIILKIIELKKKYRILNSTATLWDVYHDRWERPSDLCLVFANSQIYPCCRAIGNQEACQECGYLGYPEIINITNLRPSALWAALQYLPQK